jgi:hypothetical protein
MPPLTNYSRKAVFIPPFKNGKPLSQTQDSLEKEFKRLQAMGIEVVLYLGGMNLDYERYNISHLIPCVLLCHSPVDLNMTHYEGVTITEIDRELSLCNDQLAALDTLIREDIQKASNSQPLKNLLIKYEGAALLTNWLKLQRVLIGWNMDSHGDPFKSAFLRNKVGLKINMNLHNSKYLICGNPVREDTIFR